ncbi:ankyrin repeat domain-containing protein [Candidatus Jidaibacter acanthamoebae]|uniref:ankyrin repeat domain-containing protein n=1 Tax=Candidatus Jidaibacter acanthamoebae TaxID=86105 RepID=UPI00057D4FB0|nr:ankyrin repeat domain-containing protein [Candidatus Jidaibacter acanthamoeba]
MQNFIFSLPIDYQILLLQKEINLKNSEILHYAVQLQNIELIEFITQHAKDVNWNKPDNYGNTPIKIARRYGQSDTLKALIHAGANISNQGILDDAVGENNIELIEFIAQHAKDVDWNEPDVSGFTPLRLATLYNNPEIVKTLIRVGANISNQGMVHYAVRENNIELIEFIAQHAKDVDWNETNYAGNTPLKVAIYYDHKEIVKALIHAGATPEALHEIEYIDHIDLMDNFPIYNICQDDKFKTPFSNLLSFTYSEFSKDTEIYNNILNLAEDKTLYNILYTTALDRNSIILLVNTIRNNPLRPEVIRRGYYTSQYNKIVVKLIEPGLFPKGPFIHELSHKLMNQIFDNKVRPYCNTTEEFLYHAAIEKVLDNIISYYFRVNEPQNIVELKQDYYSLSTYERGQFLSGLSIYKAAAEGDTKVIEFFAKHGEGINWNKPDLSGYTPLMLAELYNRTETAESLIKTGARGGTSINNQTKHLSNFPAQFPLIQSYSPKPTDKCIDKVTSTFLNIYFAYNKTEEDVEFIVRYPQTIAEGCYHGNKLIQKILEPIREYWDTVVEERIKEYNLAHDASKYCLINDSPWKFMDY